MLTPDYDYYYDVDYKDDSQCRSSSWEPVCQDHGTCVQGMCKCDNDNTPKGRYYGQYCQCNDWSCPEEYEWSVEKNMIVPIIYNFQVHKILTKKYFAIDQIIFFF